MKWRYEAPDRDGFWFYRSAPSDETPVIVEVEDGKAILPCMGTRHVSVSVSIFTGPVQWAGPIPEPEEASK